MSCQRYLACGVVEVEKEMQSSSHLEAMVKIHKAQKDEPSSLKQQLEEQKEVSCEKNENDDMLDQVSYQDSDEDGCLIDDLLPDKLSIPVLVLRLVATMAVDHLEKGECFLEGRECFRDYVKWSLQADFSNSRVQLTFDEFGHVLGCAVWRPPCSLQLSGCRGCQRSRGWPRGPAGAFRRWQVPSGTGHINSRNLLVPPWLSPSTRQGAVQNGAARVSGTPWRLLKTLQLVMALLASFRQL